MTFKKFLDCLLGDKVSLSTYRILAHHSEGLTGRSIASLVKTSPFKINQVLRRLVEEGVLESSVVGRAHLYRFNQRHTLVTNILLPLIKREEEFLLELGRIMMSKLDPKPLSIILYGSIARGDERPSSDLDLCLVYSDESRSVEPITSTGNLLWEWATRTYGNPVALRRASISEFCKRTQERDSLIQNIVREGVVISGLSIQEILDYYGNKKKHYGSPKRKIQGISK